MRASLDKLSLRPIYMTHDPMGLREHLRLRVARSQFEALLGDPPGSVMVGRHRSHVKPSNQDEHLLSEGCAVFEDGLSARKHLLHFWRVVSLDLTHRVAQRSIEPELQPIALSPLAQCREQLDRSGEVLYRLDIRPATPRALACLPPMHHRRFHEARFGVVMREDFWRRFACIREMFANDRGDAGMQ